jgi:hypothetical protein
MREKEFINYLDDHPSEFEYIYGEYMGDEGIYLRNKKYETELHMTCTVIQEHDLESLLKATHCGRNVDKITRVTGFFSKVSGWNKGKRGELQDRYRGKV